MGWREGAKGSKDGPINVGSPGLKGEVGICLVVKDDEEIEVSEITEITLDSAAEESVCPKTWAEGV